MGSQYRNKRPTKAVLVHYLEKYTHECIAAIFKVNPSTVSRWKRHYRLPDGRTSRRLLSNEQVRAIRIQMEEWVETYEVSRGCIFDVLTYRTYTDVRI